MANIWSSLSKAIRLTRSRCRLWGLRLRIGLGGIPRDLNIADGVRASATDGGRIFFGPGCAVDRYATLIAKGGQLVVGDNTYVGIGATICARQFIRIGCNVLIAEYVTIRDQDHAFSPDSPTAVSGFKSAPIAIGDNVWLGAKVTVTKGVTIGKNSVIGANAVVTKDIPANAVAVGSPARVIRVLNPEELVDGRPRDVT